MQPSGKRQEHNRIMKPIRKIGIKLFLVIGGWFYILSPIVIRFFPEHFITIGIYGLLDTQREYAMDDHTDNRILIIGDSLAQVSYLPSALSSDTYNYGIGNESLIDGYYRLLEYLENHEKPEYIFCSYNPTEFGKQNSFWDTAMYQHGLSADVIKKVIQDIEKYDLDSGLERKNMCLQAMAYYYGFHPNSVILCLKGIYKDIFMDESCYERYITQREWVTEHKGHWKHYMEGGAGDDINGVASSQVEKFKVTDVADRYLRKILDLCVKEGIQVFIETIPFNRSSYLKMNSAYQSSYEEYWDMIRTDYSEGGVTVNSHITYYDDRYFADSIHFNLDGTNKFSKYIRKKYSDIFSAETI